MNMSDYRTKECVRCSRHSYQANQGLPCPWCGTITSKHYKLINWIMIVGSLVAVVAVAWGMKS